jgi:NAD(P)-dependent dehydrogenase (short-subunit alcohol dehydrogenase family)
MKTGRTVVITGASGGMGALVTERFLANGDIVFATDAKEESLKKLVDKLGASSRTRRIASASPISLATRQDKSTSSFRWPGSSRSSSFWK